MPMTRTGLIARLTEWFADHGYVLHPGEPLVLPWEDEVTVLRFSRTNDLHPELVAELVIPNDGNALVLRVASRSLNETMHRLGGLMDAVFRTKTLVIMRFGSGPLRLTRQEVAYLRRQRSLDATVEAC